MADLIDRQAAIDVIMSVKRTDNLKSVAMLIMDLPSAQPERKTGRWIAPTEDNDYWECSVCHDSYVLDVDVTPQDARMFFCPNCGAKMEVEHETD